MCDLDEVASDPGRTGHDNRQFIESVLWIVGIRSSWRDLPLELGNWHTNCTRFKCWGKIVVWQKMLRR